MANITKETALPDLQGALATIYLDRINTDFWGRTLLEIVWENGQPKVAYLDNRECFRLIEQDKVT